MRLSNEGVSASALCRGGKAAFLFSMLTLCFLTGSSVADAADPIGVVNGSFETPAVGTGYQYNPTGATWTISGAIAGAKSAWGFSAAPDGTQVCCIHVLVTR